MKIKYVLAVVFFSVINLFPLTKTDTLNINRKIIDEESGKPILIGNTTREAFTDTTYSWWFKSGYKNYDVDIDTLKPLFDDSTLLKNVNVTIVMGSWCSDSRREVPRFLKIIDGLNIHQENTSIYCVDRDLSTEDNEIDNIKIKAVPTFIFFKNNVELGRIVEAPNENLEIDMIKILTGDTKTKIEKDLEKQH